MGYEAPGKTGRYMEKTTQLRNTSNEAQTQDSLSPTDVQALGPTEDLDHWLSEWHDWLTLRVRAGEISRATRSAYTRGADKYFTFADDRNPADPDTVRAWAVELLNQYEPRTINRWLAGLKSFVVWRAETQRFL